MGTAEVEGSAPTPLAPASSQPGKRWGNTELISPLPVSSLGYVCSSRRGVGPCGMVDVGTPSCNSQISSPLSPRFLVVLYPLTVW